MGKLRNFIFILCVTLSALPLRAERVVIEKAEKVAESYIRSVPRLNGRTKVKLLRTVTKELLMPGLRNSGQEEELMYYVFGMNDNQGFIIVSADDVAVPILGYAEQGTYDETNPNFMYWMECLAQEINYAIENKIPQDEKIKVKWKAYYEGNGNTLRASNAVKVGPLIQTHWGQDSPYNNSCPVYNTESTVTGCVATVMAQIMKYWNYPVKGTGSNSYTSGTLFLSSSADFGATTYDWPNMTHSYSSLSSSTQENAVATLMFQCGVSVNMDYNVSSVGSDAYSEAVPPALKNYFNYSSGIYQLYRSQASYFGWINIIKSELDANRPVFYDGDGSAGGHAFICDGYDSNDLFHFNWGWNGSSDGYFELSALNPEVLGIGGGAGGFNTFQSIIVGIQPANNVLSPVQFSIDSLSSTNSLTYITEPFDIMAINFCNSGNALDTLLNLGLLLCQLNNTPLDYTKIAVPLSMTQGQSYPSYSYYPAYSLPATLSAGTYKLYPAFSTTDAPNDSIIIPGNYGNNFILVVVENDGTVTLSGGSSIAPNLSLDSIETVRTLYQDKPGYFKVTVTNNGIIDYNSNLILQLSNGTDELIVGNDPVVIPAGMTKTIEFSDTITLAPGDYSLSVWYDPTNNNNTPSALLGTAAETVSIQATPPAANLSITNASFPDPNNVPKNKPNFQVSIKNTGGFFDGMIIPYIFPDAGGYALTFMGQQHVSIDEGEEIELVFNNPIDLPSDNYFTLIESRVNGSGSWVEPTSYYFTLIEPAASDVTAIWRGLYSSNWSDWRNWASDSVPAAFNNIFIPGNVSYFPDLSDTTGVTVNEIHFGPGAQIGRQDLLTYSKAFVQLDFSSSGLARNQWHMLSMPVQQVYTGDFSFGGYPYTYLYKFNVTSAGSTVSQAEWTPFKSNAEPLAVGEGFALWINSSGGGAGNQDEGSGVDAVFGDTTRQYGLGYLNGIIEFPYFENNDASTAHRVHQYDSDEGKSYFYAFRTSAGLPLSTNTPVSVPRDANAYLLANLTDEPSVSETLEFRNEEEGDNNYFAIAGNPFMTTIDFDSLYSNNSDIIKKAYHVWTGNGFTVYSASGVSGVLPPNGETLTSFIAPMQSFLVESAAEASGNETLVFDITTISATNQPATLRSSSALPNKLNITASNEEASVLTFIAQREDGQDVFSDKDARKLIMDMGDVPEIYTLKPDGQKQVAVTSNIVKGDDLLIPLGISTAYEGRIAFTFSGMAQYDAKISFVDTGAGQTIDLTGLDNYEYSFDYKPEIISNQAQAKDDRFYIRFSPSGSTVLKPLPASNIAVYGNKQSIFVTSTPENPIRRIEIYNTQGVLLYVNDHVNAFHYTVSGNISLPEICIVRVIAAQGIKNVKIIKQ